MSVFRDSLLFVWRKNGKRAQDLFANIPDDRLTEQPGGFKNHAAWCLSHLCFLHPALASLAKGEAIADPAKGPEAERYGNGSKPSADSSLYPPRAELAERFARGHEEVELALLALQDPEALFNSPIRLERWIPFVGTSGTGLAYFMMYHESHHLAEIADWKKVMGLPVVG